MKKIILKEVVQKASKIEREIQNLFLSEHKFWNTNTYKTSTVQRVDKISAFEQIYKCHN